MPVIQFPQMQAAQFPRVPQMPQQRPWDMNAWMQTQNKDNTALLIALLQMMAAKEQRQQESSQWEKMFSFTKSQAAESALRQKQIDDLNAALAKLQTRTGEYTLERAEKDAIMEAIHNLTGLQRATIARTGEAKMANVKLENARIEERVSQELNPYLEEVADAMGSPGSKTAFETARTQKAIESLGVKAGELEKEYGDLPKVKTALKNKLSTYRANIRSELAERDFTSRPLLVKALDMLKPNAFPTWLAKKAMGLPSESELADIEMGRQLEEIIGKKTIGADPYAYEAEQTRMQQEIASQLAQQAGSMGDLGWNAMGYGWSPEEIKRQAAQTLRPQKSSFSAPTVAPARTTQPVDYSSFLGGLR